MTGLDTNVLIRYLAQDDPAQARKANAVVDAALARNEPVRIDTVVLCEAVWVLRTAYGYERDAVVACLRSLLTASQISVEQRDLLREALALYAAGPGDFADYVIALRDQAAGCQTTVTFDRALRKCELFTVL